MVVKVSERASDREKAGVRGLVVDLGETWCRCRMISDAWAWGDGKGGTTSSIILTVKKTDLRPVMPTVGDHCLSLAHKDTRAHGRILDVVREEKGAVIVKFDLSGECGGGLAGAEGPFRIVWLKDLCLSGAVVGGNSKLT